MGLVGAILLLSAGSLGQEPDIWHGSLEDLARNHLGMSVDPLLGQLPIFVPETRLGDPGLIRAIEALTYSRVAHSQGVSMLVPTELGLRYWTFAERYLEIGYAAAIGAWEYSRENVDWRKRRPTVSEPSKMPKLGWDWQDLVQAQANVNSTDPRWDVNRFDPWLAVFAQNLPPETAIAFATGKRVSMVVPDDTAGRLTVADLKPLLHWEPDPNLPVRIWIQLDPTSGQTKSRYVMWKADGDSLVGTSSSWIYGLDRVYANSAFPREEVEHVGLISEQQYPRTVEKVVANFVDDYSGRIVGLGLLSEYLRSVPEIAFRTDGWLVVRQFHAWRLPILVETQSRIAKIGGFVAVDSWSILDLARAWADEQEWYQSLADSSTSEYSNLRFDFSRDDILALVDLLTPRERMRIWSDGIVVRPGTELAKIMRFSSQMGHASRRELPARVRLKRADMFSPKLGLKRRGYLHPYSKRDPLDNWPDPQDRWRLDVESRFDVIGEFSDGEQSIGFTTVYQTIGYGDAQMLIEMAERFVDESKRLGPRR